MLWYTPQCTAIIVFVMVALLAILAGLYYLDSHKISIEVRCEALPSWMDNTGKIIPPHVIICTIPHGSGGWIILETMGFDAKEEGEPDRPYENIWVEDDIGFCFGLPMPDEGAGVRALLYSKDGRLLSQSAWLAIPKGAKPGDVGLAP